MKKFFGFTLILGILVSIESVMAVQVGDKVRCRTKFTDCDGGTHIFTITLSLQYPSCEAAWNSLVPLQKSIICSGGHPGDIKDLRGLGISNQEYGPDRTGEIKDHLDKLNGIKN